jgi:hypothetical protein
MKQVQQILALNPGLEWWNGSTHPNFRAKHAAGVASADAAAITAATGSASATLGCPFALVVEDPI